MELLFATLGGALLGLALFYALRGHDTFGALLLPSIGASTAAIAWAALTWVGLKFNGGWIWVITLVLAAVVTALLGVLLRRQRQRGDVELLGRLSRA